MEILERLEKEIKEQTRNGRNDIYVNIDDINTLKGKVHAHENRRIFIREELLNKMIEDYKEEKER